jgi:addiction module HigA family antidote
MIPPEAFITPGEMLRLEFLDPMGITPGLLARRIGVQPSYISKVLHGGGISPELGLLLDKYFGLSSGWFYGIQGSYEIRVAQFKLAEKLERVEPYAPAA